MGDDVVQCRHLLNYLKKQKAYFPRRFVVRVALGAFFFCGGYCFCLFDSMVDANNPAAARRPSIDNMLQYLAIGFICYQLFTMTTVPSAMIARIELFLASHDELSEQEMKKQRDEIFDAFYGWSASQRFWGWLVRPT